MQGFPLPHEPGPAPQINDAEESYTSITDAELKNGLSFWGLHTLEGSLGGDILNPSGDFSRSLPTPLTTSPDSIESPSEAPDHDPLFDVLVSPKEETKDTRNAAGWSLGDDNTATASKCTLPQKSYTSPGTLYAEESEMKGGWAMNGLEAFLDPKACGFELNLDPLDHLALEDFEYLGDEKWQKQSCPSPQAQNNIYATALAGKYTRGSDPSTVGQLTSKISEQQSLIHNYQQQQNLSNRKAGNHTRIHNFQGSQAATSLPHSLGHERHTPASMAMLLGSFSYSRTTSMPHASIPQLGHNLLDLGVDEHAGEIFPSFLETSIFKPANIPMKPSTHLGSYQSESAFSTGSYQNASFGARRGSTSSTIAGSCSSNINIAGSYGKSASSMRRGNSVTSSGITKAGPRSLSRSSSFVDPNNSKCSLPLPPDPLQCSNCHTLKTPLWRRNPEGEPLCNACGLFLKLHGEMRPLSLKTDVIRRRNRTAGHATKAKGSQGDSAVNGIISKSNSSVSLVSDGFHLQARPRNTTITPKIVPKHIPIAPKPNIYSRNVQL